MGEPVLRAKGLSKKFISYKKEAGLIGSLRSLIKREYEEKIAVDSFSLQIDRGEIVGLLGPNGAGKTTLMKMFTGIIVPSAGSLTILGHTPADRNKDFRKNIALVMGQKFQLWWDIPAMDSFELLQRYYEISRSDFKARISTMAQILEVENLLQVHVRKLSLGERMKMELMASLLHNPQIIFLDEPTIGLDLVAQEKIREFVREYQKKTDCVIILTSHYMADVEELCKRLVLIFDGKNRYDGPTHDFYRILGDEQSVNFRFSKEISSTDNLFDGLGAKWNNERTSVELLIPRETLRERTIKIMQELPVVEFNTEKMPIEKVMKTLMKNPELLRTQSVQI